MHARAYVKNDLNLLSYDQLYFNCTKVHTNAHNDLKLLLYTTNLQTVSDHDKRCFNDDATVRTTASALYRTSTTTKNYLLHRFNLISCNHATTTYTIFTRHIQLRPNVKPLTIISITPVIVQSSPALGAFR